MERRCVARAVIVGALLAAMAVAAAPAAAYSPPPVVPWETLLPGLPTSSNPAFHGVPGCATPTMACIDTEISRMDALRRRLGCDHRAVFATTYELLTIALKKTMLANPHVFDDPAWVIGEDAVFANLYFDTFAAYEHHKPIPAAWRIAFDTAARGDANAVEDMLLGINAHVQRDMPHMLAAVGLHTSDGRSRKHDHDIVNDVLNAAYEAVVDTIAKRFDPVENLIAPSYSAALGLTGNVLGDQLVQIWREEVWRNAELLLGAATPLGAQLANVTIEANAATWASLIAAIQLPPGYRAQRDAYCAAHNVGPLT
jgi:Family of unknown function (DUF5995)